MDEKQLQLFADKLEQMKEQLLEIASTSKESTRPVILDQASVGRLSRMDAMQAQQMAQESERRREAQLVRIDGALKRIKSGSFGECFVCGNEIDIRRLSVDPTLTRCIVCQEK
ncbi:MAG: TraR/DksA family transcriptional regulator [Alcanivoracaceae bacterium]